MSFLNSDKQIKMIQQGVEEIIPIDELKASNCEYVFCPIVESKTKSLW